MQRKKWIEKCFIIHGLTIVRYKLYKATQSNYVNFIKVYTLVANDWWILLENAVEQQYLYKHMCINTGAENDTIINLSYVFANLYESHSAFS